MRYTKSRDHIVHEPTGNTLHEDLQALPTVVSDVDLNQLTWELMTFLNKRGIAPKTFNPDDPETYEQVYAAVKQMIDESKNEQDYKNSAKAAITSTSVALTGIPSTVNADGVTLAAGDRILRAVTPADANNGLWVVNAGAWTRAIDANESAETTSGMEVLVERGDLYADTKFVLVTDGNISLNTTPLLFKRYGEALKKPFIIVITGQSNACGAHDDGNNPASPMVKTWDGLRNEWGGSDFTLTPWSDAAPNGNLANNNVGLALAHRVSEETGRPVYVIYDAVGGRPIEDWMGTGKTSARWASLQAKISSALASPELSEWSIDAADVVIWAQGEENALTDSFNTYIGKFKGLVKQFRDADWFDHESPLLVMGMSNLHARYQVGWAQMVFCENEDRNCIYVNSAGLKTQWDTDGTGDATHFLGVSLWEAGYYRAWYAIQSRAYTHRAMGAPMFYGRSEGRWNGQNVAIAGFSGLSSYNSKTSEFPVDGVVGLDSISWGWLCAATGRYSLAGGYLCSVDAAGRYNSVWGRDVSATATANYSGGYGYQNQLASNYGFVSGRGHIVADDAGSAVGLFSKYTAGQVDPVIHQVGTGSTNENRANGLTVRKSGLVEIATGSTGDPAQAKEVTLSFVSNNSLKFKMRGTDGIVRSSAPFTLA